MKKIVANKSKSTSRGRTGVTSGKKASFSRKQKSFFVAVVMIVLTVVGYGSYMIYQNQQTDAYSCYGRNYSQSSNGGSFNQCVKDIQQMLMAVGYKTVLAPYYADGYFGSKTTSAVKSFQTKYQSTVGAVDGVVGSKTLGKLCSLTKGAYGGCEATSVVAPTGTRAAKIDAMMDKALAWSWTSPGSSTPKVAYTSLNPTDCGVFVSAVVRKSGADTNFPIVGAASMYNYLASSTGQQKWSILKTATGSRPSMQTGDIFVVNYGNGHGHILIYGAPSSRMASDRVAFEAAINSRAPSQIPSSYVNWSVNHSGSHLRARLR